MRPIRAERERLLDEHMLLGIERAFDEIRMGGRGRGDDDGGEIVVLEEIVEVSGDPHARKAWR
jgi:hypothetical protein